MTSAPLPRPLFLSSRAAARTATRAPLAFALVAACAFSACTTAYEPAGSTGSGYSEVWRGEDRVMVTFEGNVTTRPSEAEDLAMLRAAELALQRGYPWFVVRRRGESDTEMRVQTPAQAFGANGGYIFPYAAFGTSAFSDGKGAVFKRGAQLFVVMLKQKPEGQVMGLRDAAEVRADLSRLYRSSLGETPAAPAR